MPQIDAYLMFDGKCEEAMRVYERTLGAKVEAMITYGEAPSMGEPVPPASADKIMHASLEIDGRRLMASDYPANQPAEPMQGFSLSLSYPSVKEAAPVFDALAAGGKVTMPMAKTFWAEGFGMLTDRFGTPWMVSAGEPK
ncbi:MAG: VOC family protein [Pseudomonadota bacterium]|nr:VOC family protein [Pseudomonadota bacterium]